jgi:hypothetical protein
MWLLKLQFGVCGHVHEVLVASERLGFHHQVLEDFGEMNCFLEYWHFLSTVY